MRYDSDSCTSDSDRSDDVNVSKQCKSAGSFSLEPRCDGVLAQAAQPPAHAVDTLCEGCQVETWLEAMVKK